jgi:hypothetical protein
MLSLLPGFADGSKAGFYHNSFHPPLTLPSPLLISLREAGESLFFFPLTLPSPLLISLREAGERKWEPVTYLLTGPKLVIFRFPSML